MGSAAAKDKVDVDEVYEMRRRIDRLLEEVDEMSAILQKREDRESKRVSGLVSACKQLIDNERAIVEMNRDSLEGDRFQDALEMIKKLVEEEW